MKLIVNADDLGLTAGVNQAVLLAISRGIVSSASLIVNQDNTGAAVQFLRSGLIPRVGVHLCISKGRPVLSSNEVASLVDEQGFFHRPSRLAKLEPDARDVLKEFKAQIEKARSNGIKITHLDTHHHIHRHPVVLEALISVAQCFNLPVRHLDAAMRAFLRSRDVATPDHFCGEWIGPGVSSQNLYRLIEEARSAGHQLMELMTHPGLADIALATKSSYVADRQKELAILCAPETRAWLEAREVTLCDYSACGA